MVLFGKNTTKTEKSKLIYTQFLWFCGHISCKLSKTWLWELGGFLQWPPYSRSQIINKERVGVIISTHPFFLTCKHQWNLFLHTQTYIFLLNWWKSFLGFWLDISTTWNYFQQNSLNSILKLQIKAELQENLFKGKKVKWQWTQKIAEWVNIQQW